MLRFVLPSRKRLNPVHHVGSSRTFTWQQGMWYLCVACVYVCVLWEPHGSRVLCVLDGVLYLYPSQNRLSQGGVRVESSPGGSTLHFPPSIILEIQKLQNGWFCFESCSSLAAEHPNLWVFSYQRKDWPNGVSVSKEGSRVVEGHSLDLLDTLRILRHFVESTNYICLHMTVFMLELYIYHERDQKY